MTSPAPRQRLVLDFIAREMSVGNPFPSMARIANYMGWFNTSARDCVERLAVNGYLTRERVPHKCKWGYRYEYKLKETAP